MTRISFYFDVKVQYAFFTGRDDLSLWTAFIYYQRSFSVAIASGYMNRHAIYPWGF